ncbi:MAG: amidohydrolase, partial [Gammaproteobacteria bacterium HGW-Gammaproteobacteria-7]
NLKVLYGTGHVRLGPQGVPERTGGVKATIKDGIVYDARRLLADVRALVAAAKTERGIEALPDPGSSAQAR